MRVVVHSAAIRDRDGAGLVLDKIRRRFPWLELIWGDGGCNAWQVDVAVAKVPPLRTEIVKPSGVTLTTWPGFRPMGSFASVDALAIEVAVLATSRKSTRHSGS